VAKIIGRNDIEMHEFAGHLVERPRGNETIVEVGSNDGVEKVISAIQKAANKVAPYVRNCPPHPYLGRAATYITVQPVSGELRERLLARLGDIKPPFVEMYRDIAREVDGRIQLVLHVPYPGYPILPWQRAIYDLSGRFIGFAEG